MLFWCFIVGYAIYKVKLNIYWEIFLLSSAFIGSFMPECIPSVLGIKYITVYFYWFYLGMLLCQYKESLEQYFVSKVGLLWILLFVSSVTICLFPVEYGKDVTWYSSLAVTGLVLSISYLMDRMDWTKFKITTTLVKFSSFSFGIYIWHNWVALMLISKTSQRIFGLPELAANHVILFPLCFSLITLAISWGLSWGMMKTKVGRFLIG